MQIDYVRKAPSDWIPNKRNEEDAFHWGAHDVVVDSTWSAVTFVHGLCYGTFNAITNAHHQYQRVMEALFTEEIQYRW